MTDFTKTISAVFTCMYADCDHCLYREAENCKDVLQQSALGAVQDLIDYDTATRHLIEGLNTNLGVLQDRVKELENVFLSITCTPSVAVTTVSSGTGRRVDSISTDNIKTIL